MAPSRTLCAASVFLLNVASLRLPPPESLPTIVYSIETCSAPAYEAMVKAQFDTWGKKVPRDRLIVVGGPYDDAVTGLSRVPMACGDEQSDLSCKEGLVYARGIERASKLNFDWLLVSQDDKFIWPQEFQKAMLGYDSQRPLVVASSFGCSTRYVTTAIGIIRQLLTGGPGRCKTKETEGICGGFPFLVSRGALDVLNNRTYGLKRLLDQITSYHIYWFSDIAATCMFTEYGIPIQFDRALADRMYEPGWIDMNDIKRQKPLARPMFSLGKSKIPEWLRFGKRQKPLAVHINLDKAKIPEWMHSADSTAYFAARGNTKIATLAAVATDSQKADDTTDWVSTVTHVDERIAEPNFGPTS
eukprot:gnl/TRDRNA2_/TRDRNA2_174072_c0_seq18.p1 gnl/TRDRNA2_/TRDRNA2_174072_c0~~gnl/TRDRNA2_/TRDRNA2_174072_c0_seq18.p1  ORF type:complete len:358 (+),score=27.34 gnl/TRDRNA2_/TRDRNA2_174072_c0_seq18:28-1101(+)